MLFMKNSKDMRTVQVEYRDTIVGTCLTCSKPQPGYWGRYGNEGVCSLFCATAHELTLTVKNADLRVFKKG